MAKKFNGKKMSHAGSGREVPKCPICQRTMRMALGEWRCAEMRRAPGGEDRVTILHGGRKTIKKRLRERAATA